MKTEKKQMWRDHASPKDEEGKMKAFMTAKVRPFLVISSILAVWMLLAAQHVQAHDTSLPSPTCNSLPDDAFFETPSDVTASIEADALTPTLVTKQGVGTTTREKLRYAKITIPALAAGELRVFHTAGDEVSNAALCQGRRTVTSQTSYTAHNTARGAATTARNAETTARVSGANESTARQALRTAASALTTAASALATAGHTGAADTATANANTARGIADSDTNAIGDVADGLGTAATNLETAADAFHTRFQIRATVESGDESYVLVVALADAATTTAQTLAVQFHGAIEVGDTATREGLDGHLDPGEVEDRSIHITAPGLLTLETTGGTDTVGTFDTDFKAESGGSGGNFRLVLPIDADAAVADARTLLVGGQTSTLTGSYTLSMDFKVAMGTTATPSQITVETAPGWGATAIPADDTTLQIDGSTDEDYFVFESSADGFLTVEAADAAGATEDANTTGTLYGPSGQIAMDSNSAGDHFKFRVPANDMVLHLVKVTGTTGQYLLRFTFQSVTAQGTSATSLASTDSCPPDPADPDSTAANLICPSADSGAQERDRYLIDIMESGTLYVQTTGDTDTRGTLYGPDGKNLREDDNSGQGTNFRIAVRVNPGLHIVEVRGQNRDTTGPYGLVTNFITGADPIDPTDPTDPTDPPPPTVTPDAEGELEEPLGARSGIGLVRGWACQDAGNGVEIRIMNADGTRVATFTAPYGSDRGDVNVRDRCDGKRTTDVGFAVQYNYNLLSAGTYTVEAWIGIQQVGETNTFRVARISNQEFLQRVQSGRVRVEDFPFRGDTTILEWDQPSQNFQIVDTE